MIGSRANPSRWLNHVSTPWPEERTARLRSLVALGWSASQIANDIGGVSRNAVIGKVERIGLKLARSPRKPGGDMAPRPNRNAGHVIAGIKAAQHRKEREIANRTNDTRARNVLIARARASGELDQYEATQSSEKPSNRRLVKLFKLKDNHCRFPIGEVGNPGFGFCGHKRADLNTSYCAHHQQMCWMPVSSRKISDAERARRMRHARKFFAPDYGRNKYR